MKVLIVEDNHDERKLLRYNLEHHGCEVIEACDGEEGLELAKTHKPGLIISDALMPKMDGFQFLRAIKKDKTLKSIPFVFYSATYTDYKEAELAIALGAEEFIIKPKEPEEFWKDLQTVIEEGKFKKEKPITPELIEDDEKFLRKYSDIVAVKLEEKVKELEKAKADIEFSEKKFKNLFNSIRDVILTTDLKRNILDVNQPAFKETFGYESEEVIGKSVRILYANEEEYESAGERFFNIREVIKCKMIEADFKRKNGEIFKCEISAIKLTDENGVLSGNLGVVRDITERKRMVEEIQKSEERFRQVAESAGEWIWEVDVNGLYTYSSPVVEKMLGYKPEEIVGKKYFYDLFVPDKREELKKQAFEAIDRKESFRDIVNPNMHKNGNIVILETTALPVLDERGMLSGYRGVDTDITGRRTLEEQLRQSQKMEAIGLLAGGVAHDFNNLLTAIIGYSELIESHLTADSPLCDYLKEIKKAVDRAASLTRQLLAFSRKQQLQPKVININTLVINVEKMLRRLIGEDIRLNIVSDPGLKFVKADPWQIEQVIINLAVNARDAMTEGGKLTLKTENVIIDENYAKGISYARPGSFICLSVEDTGIGMDKKTIQHIFEPFFTTKELGKGTGLGLSTVYGIVKQHEGWVNVYSEQGQGSIFKIYLPVVSQKAEDETKNKSPAQSFKGRGERILAVEDDKGIREFVTAVLSENGYVVFEAAKAEEALNIFEKEKGNFHLVLSDIVLPDKNGLQLVDELLMRKPELGVLLSSGYIGQKSRWDIIQKKGYRFIQKPYYLTDLLRAVRNVIENKKE